ncbi:hypothetical protein DV736_g1288, partial [Chaetothyriales sp. CBS 134916]
MEHPNTHRGLQYPPPEATPFNLEIVSYGNSNGILSHPSAFREPALASRSNYRRRSCPTGLKSASAKLDIMCAAIQAKMSEIKQAYDLIQEQDGHSVDASAASTLVIGIICERATLIYLGRTKQDLPEELEEIKCRKGAMAQSYSDDNDRSVRTKTRATARRQPPVHEVTTLTIRSPRVPYNKRIRHDAHPMYDGNGDLGLYKALQDLFTLEQSPEQSAMEYLYALEMAENAV